MSTTAQIEANRENAQHSTGPTTEEGKAASSQNNHRHGLAGGVFQVLPWEDQDEYKDLLLSLLIQHQPQTAFEETLVQRMAQHFWLSQRAIKLQETCFHEKYDLIELPLKLQLSMRYQATHDRAYHKLSDELRKLRNETRKQEIGFESQKVRQTAETCREATETRRQNDESRRAAAEIRKSELHSKRLALLDAQIGCLTTSAPASHDHFVSQKSANAIENSLESRSQAA